MMREMLQRRFSRALKEQAEGAPSADWPDLLLIDGGAGQLSAARDVLADLACRTSSWLRSPKDRIATQAGNGCIPTAWRHSSFRRAIRCCISCSACAMKRTALPSPPTAPAALKQSGRVNWTKSKALAQQESVRCSIISDRPAA